jgi:excisionase family DNA binding protein
VYRKKLYSPSEVAGLLGVSPITIRSWASKGDLVARSTAGGHRRFLYQDILDFANRKGMALSAGEDEKLRILVIEDDLQFAAFVKDALLSLEPPPELEFAHEGFEAGRQLQRIQPQVILLDLMLPGIDGFGICRQLRKDPETRFIRVVAMTGYDSPKTLSRILNAGADICLAKPFKVSELLNAVRGSSVNHSMTSA